MNRRLRLLLADDDGPEFRALSSTRPRHFARHGLLGGLLVSFLGISVPAGLAQGLAQETPHPPGTLYPVADMMLHMVCVGTGTPAVVFESGLGGNYLDWTYVQGLIGSARKTCAYDRAGAGWSGRTARPRTAEAMAEELHLLARAAHVPVPFILVGHSFGGLLGQNYLSRYPDEVAGLVLVDSMHPQQFARFEAAGVDVPTDPHQVIGRTPAAAAAYGLPAALRGLAVDLASNAKSRVFVVREMTAMLPIAAEVDTESRPKRPVRVLGHGNREWDGPYPDGRMEQAWRAMQDDLAVRFTAPPVTLVPGSGHEIPLDAPSAVVTAIDEVAHEIGAP